MGLLDSLLAAAMQGQGQGAGQGMGQGMSGLQPGAAPQGNAVASALMALLTGGDQAAAGGPAQADPTGADALRPPPGGKRPSMGGGLKDPMPGASPADPGGMAGLGGLGGLLSGLMGGAGAPGAMPMGSPAPGGAGLGGGALGGGALAAGLAALLQQFMQNGMGQQAASWVGSGTNMPIDPQALTQAVGADRLSMLAARYGVPREELAAALAEQLPQAVHELTPQGAVPEPDAMEQMLSQLMGGGRRGGF